MKLHVINTGSVGNCYLLKASTGEILMIECGVPFKEIQKALDFDYSGVVGCLVSHEHKDHCKAVKDVLNNGISVYATEETRKTSQERCFGFLKLEKCECQTIGSFAIIPFLVNHDAVDPVGFLIRHPECGVVLFATDTYYLKQTFKGLNNIIIEANYCEDILNDLEAQGKANTYVSDRVRQSHMSIQQTINTLNANDLTTVNNIVLIHLSDGNSDEKRFKSMVEKATGKRTFVASKGMEIDFNLTL